jgi:predicted site-specific integrase-resolvase
MEPPERLLTRRQTAERFGVHIRTLARWNRKGFIPSVDTRFGKMYRVVDVERILEEIKGE